MKNLTFILILFLLIAGCESKTEKAARINNTTIHQRIEDYFLNPKNNMMDIWGYHPLYYAPLDTLTNYWIDSSMSASYHMIHVYEGKNVAGRNVKRTASVFFNNGLEVISIQNILYHNPVNKDSLKRSLY